MNKRTAIWLLLLLAPLLTACQTTRLSGVEKTTLCLALTKADPRQYYTPEDLQLVKEKFSKIGRDGQKMALALRKELRC